MKRRLGLVLCTLLCGVLILASCGATDSTGKKEDLPNEAESIEEKTEEEKNIEKLDALFSRITHNNPTVGGAQRMAEEAGLFYDYRLTGTGDQLCKIAFTEEDAKVISNTDARKGDYCLTIEAGASSGSPMLMIEYHCLGQTAIYTFDNPRATSRSYPEESGYYIILPGDKDSYLPHLSCKSVLDALHPQYPTKVKEDIPETVDYDSISLQTIEKDGVSIEIPKEWEVIEDEKGTITAAGMIEGQSLSVSLSPLTEGVYNISEKLDITPEEIEVDGYQVCKALLDAGLYEKIAYVNFSDGYIFFKVDYYDKAAAETADFIIDSMHIKR